MAVNGSHLRNCPDFYLSRFLLLLRQKVSWVHYIGLFPVLQFCWCYLRHLLIIFYWLIVQCFWGTACSPPSLWSGVIEDSLQCTYCWQNLPPWKKLILCKVEGDEGKTRYLCLGLAVFVVGNAFTRNVSIHSGFWNSCQYL